MKFTKAQGEILDALANGEPVYNINQRMRAIQPLIDAGLVCIQPKLDKRGEPCDYVLVLI